MVTYTSKFNMLHESAFSRYTQGAGFLAGDVVKFKSNVARSDWFKSKPETMQKLILAMADAPGNLRIGVLKNEFPYAIGAHGASDNPAILADIYVELSPANWAYPMTVPLSVLERVDTGINHAPVPDAVKDKNRTQIKGAPKGKGKDKLTSKQTEADDSQRQLPTKNTILPNGKKWNDSKPGAGNLPKTKLKESVTLEDAYSLVQENTDMPLTAPDTTPEDAQHVIEGDEFNDCDYSETEDGNISVAFDDTVYSPVVDDEIPVRVIAICSRAIGEDAQGWLLSTISITDAHGKKVTVNDKDTDYLSSRATDFAHKYNGKASAPVEEDDGVDGIEGGSDVYDEAKSQPGTVSVGRFNIRKDRKVVGREDPTERLTYRFDNGYKLINFWGWELLDPQDHRIFYIDKSADASRELKRMGFPTIDEIDDAFDAIEGSEGASLAAMYDRMMGDMNP